MGCKRSVRVLFVDGGSGAAARAVELALELGQGWLEGRVSMRARTTNLTLLP